MNNGVLRRKATVALLNDGLIHGAEFPSTGCAPRKKALERLWTQKVGTKKMGSPQRWKDGRGG